MNTERLLLDTDNKGNLKGLPKFPPNKKVEAIFMIILLTNGLQETILICYLCKAQNQKLASLQLKP